MKKIHLLYLSFLLTNVPFYAQNLVLNPSFETTTSCPMGPGELDLANNWDDANSNADTCSSPDLYAACSWALGGVNSPNALLGFQPSRTGSNHAGIILFEGVALFDCTPFFSSNYREYLQGTLSQPLDAGKTYCVSFYINLANNAKWGTDDIGVYFSNTQVQYDFCNLPAPLPYAPQLEYIGPPLMDTANWVQLQWYYTATGGEQYFVIGNFKDDANTTRVDANCTSFHPYMYYFIDDVRVEELPGTNDSVYVAGDTLVCKNQSVTLTVVGASEVLWANGDTSHAITTTLLNDSLFQVQVTVACTTYTIQHLVVVDSCSNQFFPVIQTTSDSICPGQCTNLWVSVTPKDSIYTFSWIDFPGQNDSLLVVCPLQTTTYFVIVNDTLPDTPADTVSITIEIINNCPLVIPNVVSANGDGMNDLFIIQGLPPNTRLTIYNRWGYKIYQNDNYANDFDPASYTEGVYYYIVETPYHPPQKGYFHIFK